MIPTHVTKFVLAHERNKSRYFSDAGNGNVECLQGRRIRCHLWGQPNINILMSNKILALK